MNALQTTLMRLGFEAPPVVEQRLVRGTLTGAAVAAAGVLMAGGGMNVRELASFVVPIAAALLILVLPSQSLAVRAGIGVGAVMATLVLPRQLLAWPYFFTVPLGLALAYEATSPVRKLVAFAGPSLGAAWCLLSVKWLSLGHLGAGAVLAWVALFSVGLFITAGAALAGATFAADSVAPRLAGEPKLSAAWLELRSALAKLPKGAARDRLEALAHEGAERCVKAIAERDSLSSTVDSALEQESLDAVRALEERLAETADRELQLHLAQLLRVHRDTLEQFDGLKRRVERLDARVAAETGWLETAAFSVELSPKSDASLGDLQTRLVKLSPLPFSLRQGGEGQG